MNPKEKTDDGGKNPPDEQGSAQGSEVIELALCETKNLILKPDTLYRFTVMENCDECARLAAAYNPKCMCGATAVKIEGEWKCPTAPEEPFKQLKSERLK